MRRAARGREIARSCPRRRSRSRASSTAPNAVSPGRLRGLVGAFASGNVAFMHAIQIFESDGCAVACDSRHLPVVFATWFGTSDEALVDRYFAWSGALNERLYRIGQRFVSITDTLEAQRPSPMVRKHISELTKAQPEWVEALTVANFIVLDNPVMRGTITALSWLIPDLRVTPVGTLIEAIERAHRALAEAGVPPPLALSAQSYRRPGAVPDFASVGPGARSG
jgi:hypothetical protein